MSGLTLLAERVERLTGPCRETDCLIFETSHRLLTPERRGTIDGEPTGEYYDLSGNHLPERAPAYTASLDAAMTLVPEGYFPRIDCRMRMPETIIFDAKGKIAIGAIGAMTATGSLVGAALRLRARLASEAA